MLNLCMNDREGRKAISQLFRYVLVGLGLNLTAFAMYLVLTNFYIQPKTAMSIIYVSCVVISFFANQKITFRFSGESGGAALRFSVAQLIGYVLNLVLLIVFVDCYGFPHQIVQAVAILVVAFVLFILLRLYVFRSKAFKDIL